MSQGTVAFLTGETQCFGELLLLIFLYGYLDAEFAAVGERDNGVDAVAGAAHAGGFAVGPIENHIAGVFGDGEFAVVR